MTDTREYWQECWGTIDDVIAEVVLDAEPGTVVTIIEETLTILIARC